MNWKGEAAPPRKLVELYDAQASLADARTPPASWYLDPAIFELEQRSVFAHGWQMAARTEQLRELHQYVTTEVAGQPIALLRGSDGLLRAFSNVCRHRAAAVLTEPEGYCSTMRCPYHGWTYNDRGELIGTPDFAGVRRFDRAENGLVSVEVDAWEKWVFVKPRGGGGSLAEFIGAALCGRIGELRLETLTWMERRRYTVECNWKVFVDNYLDGGYHVPHVHTGLGGVLDYSRYTIQNGQRWCLQSSPMAAEGGDAAISRVRRGRAAFYLWVYPNFMINWYEGVMDTNLVCPLSPERTEVVFDYYFADISPARDELNRASIATSERIQDEDAAICRSVQRGLRSRAYDTGRLSVRREAGEHLFHRLLHADLLAAVREKEEN